MQKRAIAQPRPNRRSSATTCSRPPASQRRRPDRQAGRTQDQGAITDAEFEAQKAKLLA